MQRIVAIVMAGVALLASCSVDESSASSSATGGQPATLPFDAVLIDILGTDDVESYLAERENIAAEITAECMREAGFEFALPMPEITPPTGPEIETLDYARRAGFGLIIGFRDAIAAAETSTGDINDVNRAYLRSLSGDEIERFFLTLEGEPAEPGQLPTETGCNGEGSERAYADWVRFSEALPQYTAMGEERDTHPDWLAARAEWRDCMLGRGYDYAEPDAIRTDVAARIERQILQGRDFLVIESEDGIIVDPEVDALLDEMLAFEQSAAVANIECTAPLADRFEAVEREVQEGFIDRNQQTIDRLLSAG